MAPEVLPTKYRKKTITVQDMLVVDMFAYGMLLHALLNPGTEPFFRELEEDDFRESFEVSDVNAIADVYNNEEYARFWDKFIRPQMECWGRLMWVYLDCAQINPERRPTPSAVIDVLNCWSNPRVLKYSQQSSILMQDREFAQRMHDNEPTRGEEVENDGINACVFLALKICFSFEQCDNEIGGLIITTVILHYQ